LLLSAAITEAAKHFFAISAKELAYGLEGRETGARFPAEARSIFSVPQSIHNCSGIQTSFYSDPLSNCRKTA
jgi:hypothetical protein